MTELIVVGRDLLELAGFGVGTWLVGSGIEWVYQRDQPTPPPARALLPPRQQSTSVAVPTPRTPGDRRVSGG